MSLSPLESPAGVKSRWLDSEEQGSIKLGPTMTTLDDGYLGSKLDEGRSKVR